MAQRKLAEDEAFEHYYALGAGRSYRAVAEEFGVSKTAVANAAERGRWRRKVEERDHKVAERVEEKAVESVEQDRERQLKMVRLVQGKAIEALKTMPLESAMDAVRALGMAIKEERLIRGEPTERTALSVEDTIRREYDRWMTTKDESEDLGEEDEDDDARS